MRNVIKLGLVFGMSAFLFASCAGENKAEITQYQCPMNCEVEKTYEKAGICPVCKMDLKEVK
jgi:hypothetical protein